ncbi:hypothetical protein ACO2J1_12115 [Leptospira interrogans]|uniref:Uncharacterized protein n=2 Tax=Leptospira interrogans TaxID=173 RepID=A0A0F6I8J9_LEPIR|nr:MULTISPECIES: hypothetical protein [Leptospira]ASV05921.1 hypothetical protein B2G47_07775 [Leptospira interrogans serovar Canicola]EJO79274.1 hypothetical protein LEP1GSC045_3522 [Leptospira interrogans serovar Pomona str. Kennewicki LC82-25]EKN99504.1 hypothetical protein LEP1GSC014_2255 [Leptospira interrogans serovar Pomona str. Pomona]EKO69709.1 hypothetical protein LEP1GSC069_1638 [Leptospira interrogans serovar Canicola str. Fiocruz LV133]EKR26157.1 hypothetical protein LEP1GSC087_28
MVLGLIYTVGLDIFLILMGSAAFLGLCFLFFKEVIYPTIKKGSAGIGTPPEEGDRFLLVVPESQRNVRFSVGQTSGNIRTYCNTISDNHLIFNLKKAKDSEDYEIQILRNSAVLFKPPGMPTFSKMESSEKLDSYEVIGKSADFRISDKVVKERMTQYFEIGLSSEFFINNFGKERMRFIFTITKIHPGLNRKTPIKKGLYAFGKEEREEPEE